MQISTSRGNGLVSIANGSNIVIATSLLADWSEAIAGNSWFTLIGDTQTLFTIQDLTDPAHSGSGFWEAALDGVFALPSVVGVAYAIHKDFTEPLQLPLFSPGDVERNRIWNRAMWIIAQNSGGGGGGTIDGLLPLVSLAIPTLTTPKPRLFSKIATVDGQDVLQWWLLQAGAPTVTDTPTSDDATSRWRQVG